MESATWYLGPLGDLRALTVPDPGIEMTLERYGGVHQGLSGARTMDVTGHRYRYQFSWNFLEKEEWAWLEAMHTRLIPGPFRLLNPMKKNLLSVQSSTFERVGNNVSGLGITGPGTMTMDWDSPSALAIGARCLKAPAASAQTIFRFDSPLATAVLPEAVTASIYLKAASPAPISLALNWCDRTGQIGSGPLTSASVTTSWQRFSVTGTPAAGVGVGFAVTQPANAPEIRLAAPQMEFGTAPTEWEMGGGSTVVLMDQLSTTSRRYPLTDCNLTLLEA